MHGRRPARSSNVPQTRAEAHHTTFAALRHTIRLEEAWSPRWPEKSLAVQCILEDGGIEWQRKLSLSNHDRDAQSTMFASLDAVQVVHRIQRTLPA